MRERGSSRAAKPQRQPTHRGRDIASRTPAHPEGRDILCSHLKTRRYLPRTGKRHRAPEPPFPSTKAKKKKKNRRIDKSKRCVPERTLDRPVVCVERSDVRSCGGTAPTHRGSRADERIPRQRIIRRQRKKERSQRPTSHQLPACPPAPPPRPAASAPIWSIPQPLASLVHPLFAPGRDGIDRSGHHFFLLAVLKDELCAP